MNIVRLGRTGYALPSIVVIIESATHTPPLAASPLAMALSAAGLAALVIAGALVLSGILVRPRPSRT